jgi:hypothetical protein|tara:strand:+ start:127 stop:504 length:378 start_codon:yes stop_codon:yes gene_type:complete
MLYSVIGGTKKERETVTEALWFAKQYLLPRHRKLAVDVEISPKLIAEADILEGDDEREYEMRVRKGLSKEDLITAIFHEFVHIKQDVRKEFPMFESTDIPYFERPWEIEAYAMQEKMLESFNKAA